MNNTRGGLPFPLLLLLRPYLTKTSHAQAHKPGKISGNSYCICRYILISTNWHKSTPQRHTMSDHCNQSFLIKRILLVCKEIRIAKNESKIIEKERRVKEKK